MNGCTLTGLEGLEWADKDDLTMELKLTMYHASPTHLNKKTR
jgi:hypothetical protein